MEPFSTRGAATRAYVYYGAEEMTDDSFATPAFSLDLPAPLDDADGTRFCEIAPGDYNGDGFGDIAVSLSGSGVETPTVYVLLAETDHGGAYVEPAEIVDLEADADVVIDGFTENSPITVANAGNINGDLNDNRPVDDILVGASGADDGTGAVYVFQGNTNWRAVGGEFESSFTNVEGDSDAQGFVAEVLPECTEFVQWHLSERRSVDSGHTAPHSWYLGRDDEGNYNVGDRVGGTLTSPEIDLAGIPNDSDITLSFNYLLRTEDAASFDTAEVEISKDGGDFVPVAELEDSQVWTPWSMTFDSSSSYRNGTIQVRFKFDSGDYLKNNHEGWYVDDVVVESHAIPLTVSNPAHYEACLTGTVADERLGTSVTALGDLDQDGSDEFAVLGAGKVYVVPGGITGTSDVGSPTGIAAFTHEDTLTDYRLFAAGDVDGDDRPDLLLSGPDDAYLIFGKDWTPGPSQPLPDAPDFSEGNLFPLGDVNGDGSSDLGQVAVETSQLLSPATGTTSHLVGRVFLGDAEGVADTPDLVVETARPFFAENATATDLPSGRFFFAGLGNVAGVEGVQLDPDDFAIADNLPGGGLHIFAGRELSPNNYPLNAPADPDDLYRYALATPLISAADDTLSGVDLHDEDTHHIRNAAGLTGSMSGEQLTSPRSIGDVNGDRFEDFLVEGAMKSYVLFGPLSLETLSAIDERADVVVWHEDTDVDGDGMTDDVGFGRPAARMCDVNGDGIGDLIFVEETETNQFLVNIAWGSSVLPRELTKGTTWDAEDGDNSVDVDGDGPMRGNTIAVTGLGGSLDNITVQAFNSSGDEFAELLVSSKSLNTATTIGLLFDGHTIKTTPELDSSYGGQMQGAPGSVLTWLGDVDGDGRDELALRELTSGNTGIVVASPTAPDDTAVQDVFPLGDVNRDGYDDFAGVATSVPASKVQDQVMVFAGAAVPGFTDPITTIRRIGPTELDSNPLSVTLTATAGDFSGDGETDLAVLEYVALDDGGTPLSGRLYVFWSICEKPGDLLLSDADVVIDSGDEAGVLDSLASGAFDLNADGIDDMLLGASRADAFTGGLLDEAGKVFAVYGSRTPKDVPESFEPLENYTVSGSGGFVVDAGDGKPVTFDLTLDQDAPDGEQWYRFTTVGDGLPGDYVYASPEPGESQTLHAQAVGEIGSDSEDTTPQATSIGGESSVEGIFEFDLSSLINLVDDPDTLDTLVVSAELKLDYTSELLHFPHTFNLQEYAVVPHHSDQTTEELYFAADGKLWRTDGAAVGTIEILTGDNESITNPAELTLAGSTLFFVSDNCLWKLNTTSAVPRAQVVKEGFDSDSEVEMLTAVEGRLFFRAKAPDNGADTLWLVNEDATDASVVQHERVSGDLIDVTNPELLTCFGGTLFFTSDIDGSRELWLSGLNSEGAELVQDVRPGQCGSNPTSLVQAGANLFWVAEHEGYITLFKTDATQSVRVTRSTSSPLYNPSQLTAVSDDGEWHLYFRATESAPTDSDDFRLWSNDGTASGSSKVLWLDDPDGDGVGEWNEVGTTDQLTACASGLFFRYEAASKGQELWVASEQVASLVFDIAPRQEAGSDPDDLTNVDGTLYFTADNGDVGCELWRHDPGNGVTELVRDISPALSGDDDAPEPANLIAVGDTLFFVANDGTGETLWKSDGTEDGTTAVAEDLGAELLVEVLPDEGDNRVTAEDALIEAAKDFQIRTTIHDTADVLSAQSVNVMIRDAVRNFLAVGRTRMTIRVSLPDRFDGVPQQNVALDIMRSLAEGSSEYGVPAPGPGETALVVNEPADGVLFDVYEDLGDGKMGLITAGRSLVDLRHFDAGTYFLRVYNPAAAPQERDLPFTLEFAAPAEGETRPTYGEPDRDVIHGGDGNDVLMGNEDVDRLFGDSGLDTFVTDVIVPASGSQIPGTEVRDLQPGETLGASSAGQTGPVPTEDYPELDPIVEIPDRGLRLAVADTLGIPVIEGYDGEPLLAYPVYASDMAEITYLDAGNRGITDLTGLEAAINLRTFNLANNDVTDISPILPGMGGEAGGLRSLESLAIDSNPIVDVAPLSRLTSLRFLSMDGVAIQTESGESPLSFVETLTQLRHLSIRGDAVDDIEPLSNLADLLHLDAADNCISSIDALLGQTIIDNFETTTLDDGRQVGYVEDEIENTGWTGDRNDDAFEGDYRILPSQAAPTGGVEFRFTDIASDTYDLFATWPAHETRTSEATFTVTVTRDGHVVDSFTATANQRLAPDEQDDSRPAAGLGTRSSDGTQIAWLNLGTLGLRGGDEVTVRLTGSADGNLAADAVRLQRAVLQNLTTADLRGNPLDSAAHEYIVDTITADVLTDANDHSPVFNDAATLTTRSTDPGEPITVEGIQVHDPDGDPVFLTAYSSDTDHLQIAVDGDGPYNVTITPEAGFNGNVTVTLVAHDGPHFDGDHRGRTAELQFDVHVGTSAIYGTEYEDSNANRTWDWNDDNANGRWDSGEGERPLEGWSVYLDVDESGDYSAGDLMTVSDVNGTYSFASLPMIDAPEAYLLLDAVSGNALDATGNGHDGQVVGATWNTTAGRIDGALEFDGLDDYVILANPESLVPGPDDWSFSAWFRTTADDLSGRQTIYTDLGDDAHYGITIALDDGRIQTRWHAPVSGSADGGTYRIDGNATIETGEWYHVAVVREGDQVIQYIDGVEDGRIDTAADGDLVWHDQDEDGVYNAETEPGIVGCVVELFSPGINGTIEYGDPNGDDLSLAIAVTDHNGRYEFEDLASLAHGTYYLAFRTPSGGYAFTAPGGDSSVNDQGVVEYSHVGNATTGLNAGLVGDTAEFGWASTQGGVGDEVTAQVVCDADGNVYTTGTFEQTVDFDPGPGVYELASRGSSDAFVAKYSPSGALIWVRQIGGTGEDQGLALDVEDSALYVTGAFTGTATVGSSDHTLTGQGITDAYLARWNLDGGLDWVRRWGGTTSSDLVEGQEVDAEGGRVVVAGQFAGSADFDANPTSRDTLTASYSGRDVFVTAYTADGDFSWVKGVQGRQDEAVYGLAVSPTDDTVVVVGSFRGQTTFAGGATKSSASESGYVVRLAGADGSPASVQDVSAHDEYARAVVGDVAIAPDGETFVTGFFYGQADFGTTIGNKSSRFANQWATFIAEVADDSADFAWARFIDGTPDAEGSSNVRADGIAVDNSGNLIVTGIFRGTADFDPGTGQETLTAAGDHDLFVATYGCDGGFLRAEQLGGTGRESAIRLGNKNSGQIDYDHTSTTFKHTMPEGPEAKNRILVVEIVHEQRDEALVPTVLYGGQQLTRIPGTISATTAETMTSEFWYLRESSIAARTSDILSVQYSDMMRWVAIGAVSLLNVSQQSPEPVAASDSLTVEITTLSDGAWVLDAAGFHDVGAEPPVSPVGGNQEEVWSKGLNNPRNNALFGRGTRREVLAAGTVLNVWANADVRSLAAFAPVGFDRPSGLAVAPDGSLLIAGHLRSSEFDFAPEGSEYTLNNAGGTDGFVTRWLPEAFDDSEPSLGGDPRSDDWYFEGLLDDVKVFDYALQPDEITLANDTWFVREEVQPGWRVTEPDEDTPVISLGGAPGTLFTERTDFGNYHDVLPGDLNADGLVGSADLDIIRANWGQTVPAGSLIDGDPSGDGMVGSADLDIIRANWGSQIPTAASSDSAVQSSSNESLRENTIYGPPTRDEIARQSLADAAFGNWEAARAAWLDALDALETRQETGKETTNRRAAVDLVLEGMAEE